MSEPVTNFDTDDVLESVRRLVRNVNAKNNGRNVAESVSTPAAATPAAEPDRLVLTPALRVLDSQDLPSRGKRGQPAPQAEIEPELVDEPEAPLDLEAAVARLEAAVTRQLGAWEPDGSEPTPDDNDALDPDEARILPVAPVEEAAEDDLPADLPAFRHTGANAAFLDMLRTSRARRGDDQPRVIPTLTLSAGDAVAKDDDDRPRSVYVAPRIDPIPEPEPTIEAMIARSEALDDDPEPEQTDVVESLLDMAVDEAEDMAEDEAEAPFAEVEPEPAPTGRVEYFSRRVFRKDQPEPLPEALDEASDMAEADMVAAEQDEAELDEAELAEAAFDEDALAEDTLDDGGLDDEDAQVFAVHQPWEDVSPEDAALEADDEDAVYYQDELPPELEAHDAGDAADDFDPELENYLNGPSPIDDARLRAMIQDVLRDELQGPLGERITRNVRKLVRREIYRVLSSEDLA